MAAPHEKQAIMSPEGAEYIAGLDENHPDLVWWSEAYVDFRRFLDGWHFIDQESGRVRVLGHVLWDAQEEFVRSINDPESIDEVTGRDWIFFLKARKLGETTIECAYDGWVLRCRDPLARVHLFSRRDDAAKELLAMVKFGLERLPWYAKLSVGTDNDHEYELIAGEDDRRLAKAYPADEDTAVEASCTHGHVDEWARMRNPQRVWQAIEPSMAGSCHIVTTGLGPTNYSSRYWRRCLAGDSRHNPVFIGALSRPGRSSAWLKAQRAGMDEQSLLHEYPLRWEDALSGGGDYVFKSRDVDMAGTEFMGLSPRRDGRRYLKIWDIGRHKDAAVGICLDVTDDVLEVVDYDRIREHPYPFIQRRIEAMHSRYPGKTVVEKNSAGEAVLENLDIPERQLEGWNTSGKSKARIISKLEVAVQNWLVRWDPEACSQLDAEVRGYQIPDDHVVQDSVIALAIGVEMSESATQGRVLSVMHA